MSTIKSTSLLYDIVKLEDICETITDGTHQTPTYADSGVTFLSSKNVKSGRIDWANVKYVPQSLHEEYRKRLQPQRDDLLLAKNGTTGVAAIVDRDDIEFSIYVSLALLRPTDAVNPKYLFYAVNAPNASRQFNRSLKGVGVPNLHLKEIRNTKIPLPPLSEQKRIADILDKADAIRRKRELAIEEADKLANSLISSFCEKTKSKPRKIDELIKDKVLLTHKDGNFGGSYPRKHEFGNDGIPFLTAKHVTVDGDLILNDVPMLNESKARTLPFGWIEAGDVLLAHNATVGPVALYRGQYNEALIGTSLTCYRPNPEFLTSEYLFAALRGSHFQQQLKKQMSQTTRNQVPITAQRKLTIHVPQRDAQIEFGKQLLQIQNIRKRYAAAVDESSTLFNSLVQRAFKGEL